MITERLFQFIWQFQYFNKRHLQTIAGEALEIISPGQLNHNQGPDFLNARVRIGNTILAGNIELHLTEADWTRHSHTHDPNYRNIILHVLWEHPESPGLSLPTISLKDRVSKILLQRFGDLMRSKKFVPCAHSVQQVPALILLKWKERLLAERLIRKSGVVLQYLHQCNQHWEEVFWWMLARNFGIPINWEPFEAMARSISLNIIARHRNHVHQLEALLLGQAGLLRDDFHDPYARALAADYNFYRVKYQLQPIHQQVHFLRMRPSNFPTVRLAQLAMLLNKSYALFSHVKEVETIEDLYELLYVTASEHWNTHYMIDEPTAEKVKTLGAQMIENIIINTMVPMLFAYGHFRNEQRCKDKALEWLGQLAPEKNTITNQWAAIGITNQHAWDSQALIELKKEYCDAKRCLECSVGSNLLKPTVRSPAPAS